MLLENTFFTTLLLGAGAFATTLGPAQVGQDPDQPRRAEVESVRLDLELEQGAKFHFEVTQTHPTPARGFEDPPGAERPGTETPGVGERGRAETPGGAGASTVLHYELHVSETDDNGLTTLEVKKTHKTRAGMRGTDEEPWQDHEKQDKGEHGKARDRTYVVKVTATGEIRDIQPKGDDVKHDDDAGKGFQAEPGTHVRTDEQASVRDHLHAFLGTGLHDRELRPGEIVYLGQPARTAGRPVEAGARDLDDPHAKDKPLGVAKELKLTGMALELRAVETRGNERIARFRILDEKAMLHPGQPERRRGPDDKQDGGFGDPKDKVPGTGIGQDPGLQDEARTAGLAAYRVGDGLLEELTYLERIGASPPAERGRPGQQDRDDDPLFGDQDRGQDVGGVQMPRMRSISIRRVEG